MTMPRYYPTSKLIAPIFIDQRTFFSTDSAPGEELRSIPGFSRLNRQQALLQVESLIENGIGSVLIYPLIECKGAAFVSNPAQQMDENFFLLAFVKLIKERYPGFQVILDLCLCHYSDAGQCGIIEQESISNSLTLEALERLALLYAGAGADALMLSGMMDGAVRLVRRRLESAGFTQIVLMAQSAKLDSSLYGPFQKLKHAPVGQALKSTYQVDPADSRQMRREVALDLEEGADVIVLKPILNSVEILPALDEHQRPPVFGYMTGGEYALLRGTLPEKPEQRLAGLNAWLCNLERAGLDAIFCYIAEEYAHLRRTLSRQTI